MDRNKEFENMIEKLNSYAAAIQNNHALYDHYSVSGLKKEINEIYDAIAFARTLQNENSGII